VIVKFDGREVKESKDLPRIVGQTPVGKEVEVGIVRKGKEMTRTVKLGRLEEGEKLAKLGGTPEPEKPAIKRALGMELTSLGDEARKRYSIKEGVRGVVVTKVDANSAAADKRIQPGDVIVEVQQEPVANPDALTRRIDALKKEGKKSALLLVASAQGDMRFVAVAIE